MKRFTIFVLTLILLATTCLFSASAEEPDPIIVEYGTITVIFDGNTTLNEEQRLAIAQMLAGECTCEEEHTHICGEDNSDNIWCNLFGHKKIEEALIVVEHCVRDVDPRCRENYGILTTCSRCDYSNFVVEAFIYISCH